MHELFIKLTIAINIFVLLCVPVPIDIRILEGKVKPFRTDMIKTLLFIGTGGFLGSIFRFLASRFLQNHIPSSFPYGTFFVNISGCLLIGLIYGFSERSALLTPGWKMFLAVGFCGGFTTFSTFANENLALLRDGAFFHFFIYTGLSVFLGIAATFFGVLITKI